ncbi:hypothetical protein ACQU0X_06525 [Pseudovibrio ascidiaceicola]|uniref:hypothetical protein n=1 Tax=Pseudovibrio ascidiaceicola TaxID=285279 RepID=UPI003D36ACF9
MTMKAYVLRQYSLQSGFVYFVGEWGAPKQAEGGQWFINPKTSVKLEDAIPFNTQCRAEEWAAMVNKNQHPSGRAWQATSTTFFPSAASLETAQVETERT